MLNAITTHFVGLDVHQATISIAVADPGRGEPRIGPTIPNDFKTLLKSLKRLGELDHLMCCAKPKRVDVGARFAAKRPTVRCRRLDGTDGRAIEHQLGPSPSRSPSQGKMNRHQFPLDTNFPSRKNEPTPISPPKEKNEPTPISPDTNFPHDTNSPTVSSHHKFTRSSFCHPAARLSAQGSGPG